MGILYSTIVFPLQEVNKGAATRYELTWAFDKEIQNPSCVSYLNNDLDKLLEPEYSRDGSTCYQIYMHRKYYRDSAQLTPDSLRQHYISWERELWWVSTAVGMLGTILYSALVYGVGHVIGWIGRGFKSRS